MDFKQIIDLWVNLQTFSDEVFVDYQRAYRWYKRNSIPGAHFAAIIAAAQRNGFDQVTAEVMVAAASNTSNVNSTKSLIDYLNGETVVARALSVPVKMVKSWNDSIPEQHWPALERLAANQGKIEVSEDLIRRLHEKESDLAA